MPSAITPISPLGSRTWDERVWHPDHDGVVRPLRELWPDGRRLAG